MGLMGLIHTPTSISLIQPRKILIYEKICHAITIYFMYQDKWIHISRALMDERGPWSANPFPNDVVTHWKLDKTEDRWRRRFKLKRNYKFDERLCQPSQSRNENTGPSADQPYISAKIPEKMKRFLLKGVRGITEDIGYEPFEDTSNANESTQINPLENQNLNNAADSSDYHATVHDKKEPSSTNGDNDYTKVKKKTSV